MILHGSKASLSKVPVPEFIYDADSYIQLFDRTWQQWFSIRRLLFDSSKNLPHSARDALEEG